MALLKNITEQRFAQIDKERKRSPYLKPSDIEDNKLLRFRIVGDALCFFQGWLKEGIRKTADGNNPPIRWSAEDGAAEPQYEVGDYDPGSFGGNPISFVIAIPIWNYGSESFQVFQIVQGTIQNEMIAAEQEYGDLRDFDLQIRKEVKNKRTSYSFSMCPKHEDPSTLIPKLESVSFDINALLEDEDPFDESNPPLDLSYFENKTLGNAKSANPIIETEQTPPLAIESEKDELDWREFVTKSGTKLGDMEFEDITKFHAAMVKNNMQDNPGFKFLEAAITELEEIPF